MFISWKEVNWSQVVFLATQFQWNGLLRLFVIRSGPLCKLSWDSVFFSWSLSWSCFFISCIWVLWAPYILFWSLSSFSLPHSSNCLALPWCVFTFTPVSHCLPCSSCVFKPLFSPLSILPQVPSSSSFLFSCVRCCFAGHLVCFLCAPLSTSKIQ